MMNRKDLRLRQLLQFRHAWIAWLVFFVVLGVTVLLWQVSIHLVDERTQARHLIEHAAHPRVREELWEEAVALGLA